MRPAYGRVCQYDSECAGLAVCVTSAGTRTFYYINNLHGRPYRKRLGLLGELTVDRARKLADLERGKIAEGREVKAERRATLGAYPGRPGRAR